MEESLAEFLRHLAFERNASAYTVKSYREDLNQALGFFREQLQSPRPSLSQLSPRLLRAYVAWLHGESYAKSTMARRVAAVRSWCRYLHRQGQHDNPADGCGPPRQTRHCCIHAEADLSSPGTRQGGPAERDAPSWRRLPVAAGWRMRRLTSTT